MIKTLFSLFVTTVFTTVITVTIKKLLNRWFVDKDDE